MGFSEGSARRSVVRAVPAVLALVVALLTSATARATVNLRVAGCDTVDRCAFAAGNLNGSIEPGETGETRLRITNSGTTDATNVRAVVTTTTPGVTITQDTADFGTIASRATVQGAPPITFTVEPTVPCGTVIQFDVAITSTEQVTTGTCSLNIPVPCQICSPPMSPLLRLDSCNLTADRCGFGLGDSNGDIEPGELGTFTLTVTNIGSATAGNVIAQVTSPTRGVTITQGTANLGDIGAGRTVTSTTTINFDVDLTLGCGEDIVFDVQLNTTQGPFSGTCTMTIPDPCQPCSRLPVLSVEDCTPTDDCALGGPGDGNGAVEPGETVTTVVRVGNGGPVGATSVVATVNFASAGVTVTQDTTSFGSIPAGGIATGDVTIDYSVDASIVSCGDSISLGFTITSDQGTFNDLCVTLVPSPCEPCVAAPDLALAACDHASDDCALGGVGDGNGNVDPGEAAELALSVSNSGTSDAVGVVATVSTTTPGVTITQPTVSFGDIAIGATAPGAENAAYSVDLTVPCGTLIQFDVELTHADGTVMELCTMQVPLATCAPCVAGVSVVACTPSDSCAFGGGGHADGSVDPGEDASVVLDLLNSSGAPATGVTATVTSATPGVTITQGALTFPDIADGATASSDAPMTFSLSDSVPCGADLVFDVAIGTNEGPHSSGCTITVPAPCTPCVDAPPQPDLQLQPCVATDACAAGGAGDGDGDLAPGETATLSLGLDNAGAGDATGISAVVTTTTPGVTIIQGATTFGDIAAGGSGVGATQIELQLAGSVPCGSNVDLSVEITTDQGTFTRTCGIPVPDPCTPCATTVPPLEVTRIITRCIDGAPGVTVEWVAAPGADTYSIYQGTIAAFRTPARWDHACALGGIAALASAVPTSQCGDGQNLYYLVVGVNAAGEGPYGGADLDHDPAGIEETPRPAAATPCP